MFIPTSNATIVPRNILPLVGCIEYNQQLNIDDLQSILQELWQLFLRGKSRFEFLQEDAELFYYAQNIVSIWHQPQTDFRHQSSEFFRGKPNPVTGYNIQSLSHVSAVVVEERSPH